MKHIAEQFNLPISNAELRASSYLRAKYADRPLSREEQDEKIIDEINHQQWEENRKKHKAHQFSLDLRDKDTL